MKNLIVAILLAGAFAACQNQGTNASSDLSQDKVPTAKPKVVDEMLSGLLDAPDVDFKASLEAFRAKDNVKAAHYILQAIAEIKREMPSILDSVSKEKFENNVAALQTLADRVKDGKVGDEDSLLDLFAHVDMMTAHEYLIVAKVYAVKEPAKAESSFQRAKARIASAEKKLKGESLAECNSISTNMNTWAAKEDKKINAMGNAAGEHAHAVFMWLKNHAAKIGIHPPATDYYD